MNKTININIAGVFFHIDEDAYKKLRLYLEAIKDSLRNSEGRDDIMYDVESRIAELLIERKNHEKQIISLSDVEYIMTTIGDPEDCNIDEEEKVNYKGGRKKLYRDIDGSYIGGVCMGLSHYLRIDVSIIRITLSILTLFTWGGFFFLYIIFWILLPPARTNAQKLDMKGEPVNLNNLGRKFKEEFDNLSDKVKNTNYDHLKKKSKNFIQKFFSFLERFFKVLFNIIYKLIGGILVILSSCLLIFILIGFLKGGIFHLSFHDLNGFSGNAFEWMSAIHHFSAGVFTVFLSLIFVLFAIPLILVLISALRILFGAVIPIVGTTVNLLLLFWALAILGIIAILSIVF